MKIFFLLGLTLWSLLSLADSPMDTIASMKKNHPLLPQAIIELQTRYLKEKKWEHVLGIGQVFRAQLATTKESFRVEPFLMEAYGLIQYCHYDDARAVLNQAKYFAKKYQRLMDIQKIEKAFELEKLSQLYRSTDFIKSSKSEFSQNKIEWKIEAENESLLYLLNQVIVRTNNLCR